MHTTIATDRQMTKDLFKLAMDAGMTEQEFINEINKTYAILSSAALEQNNAEMLVDTVNFSDHDLEITARKIPTKNVSVN